MPQIGQASLYLALILGVLDVAVLFIAGSRIASIDEKERAQAQKLRNLGHLGVLIVMLSLTVGIGILLYGFMAGDFTLQYVAQNYPDSHGAEQILYQIAGVWGGRQGSLLFWAWLISIFGSWIAYHRLRDDNDRLSTVALGVTQIVLVLFISTLIFSPSNNPFIATDPSLLDADGNLIGTAAFWGMNKLLEHWAMVLHPPATFIGYAGLTIPFAYALAAAIVNDGSRRWVELSNRITLFSWLFLSIGIGLGSVWAYVVLGWGGYWGWDPVENASLLSWLTGVALLHSMTVVRKRNKYQIWAMTSAAITFIFVIMGTFITRSGLVQSVHAFAEDNVSTTFFLGMMALAGLSMLIALVLRRNTFNQEDDINSLLSKNASYYLTNVIMFAAAILLAYLTIAPALPAALPFGGRAIATSVYEGISRPLGVLFMAILAFCPLLFWGKTEGKAFWKNFKAPAIGAVIVFAVLMVIWVTKLYPNYVDNLTNPLSDHERWLAGGPSWYYNALGIIGLLVASIVITVSLSLLIRGVRARMKNRNENAGAALINLFKKSPAQAGGYLTHLGMGIILVGLVGSSMYLMDHTYAVPYKEGSTIEAGEYNLTFQGGNEELLANGDMLFSTKFHIETDSGEVVGDITPTVLVPIKEGMAGQNKLNAAVKTYPLEDLFVVFQGLNMDGTMSVNVKINPMILYVWIGFVVLVLGTVAAMVPKRATRDLKVISAKK